MPDAMIYFLKVNLALVLFCLVYRLLLRRLTFYTYNRWFLLAAMPVSVAFPLLDLSSWFAQQPGAETEAMLVLVDWSESTAVAQAQEYSFGQWFLLVYLIGVLLLLARLCLQVVSLRLLHFRSEPAVWQHYTFRVLKEEVNPFTFWRNIYLNPIKHSDQELEALLLHEQVHAQQLHSLDILLSQVTSILCWFNPVVWLLQRDIRQNLEYVADHQVLQQGVKPKFYQYSLLHVSRKVPTESLLVLRFNFNHIKDRIMMMNKEKSLPVQKLRYVLLLPLMLGLALLTSKTQAGEASIEQRLELNQNSGTATDTIVYIVDGKRIAADQIQSINPATIEQVEVVKGEQAKQLADDKDLKGVVKITTKKGGVTESQADVKAKATETNESMAGKMGSLPKDAIFILDDEPVDVAEINKLSPGQIKGVAIMKNSEKMVAKYGEKAKNGVVLIYTK